MIPSPTNIAKILNIYPRKGAVAVGADADLVVWDPKAKKKISAKNQASVIDYNVFEGFEVTGLPRFTLSRGEIVASEDGERRLAGYLLRRSADRISCRASGDRAEVDLHYDH